MIPCLVNTDATLKSTNQNLAYCLIGTQLDTVGMKIHITAYILSAPNKV